MAFTNLPNKPFLVFPTRTEVYRWQIFDTRNGSRAISRHKYLEFALIECEKLNARVAEQESAKVVSITKGQLSQRQLSDAFIRMQQDACGVNRRDGEEQ